MRAAFVSSVLLLLGCSSEPEAPPPPSFEVAVLVDPNAPPLPQADVDRVVARASKKLEQLAGVGLHVTEVRRDFGRRTDERASVIVNGYLLSNPVVHPDLVIVFSNDEWAHTYGGWSEHRSPPYPFTNRFPSPNPDIGDRSVYVAVVDFEQFFSACGYDAEKKNHVSDVALAGQCRNRAGTPCVENSDGRWVCNDESLSSPYADHDTFVSSDIVHEIAHSFGYTSDMGGADHWASPECIARVGAAAVADDSQAQRYCVMCPDIYTRIPRTPTR